MVDSYIAIDLETTGLDPKRDKIIEIGAVRIEQGKEREEFSTLINPRMELPDRIKTLTGIDDSMLRDAPGIEAVIGTVKEFCCGLPLLGHRVIFDYSFLKRAVIDWGNEKEWEKDGIDTLALCREFMPAEVKKSLVSACGYFGIESGAAHRASADARAAHRLYQILALQYEGQSPESIGAHPMIYKVKRQQPATKRQKERLHDLIKYHKINMSVQIEYLTRNEASRLTDQILSRYGRI